MVVAKPGKLQVYDLAIIIDVPLLAHQEIQI